MKTRKIVLGLVGSPRRLGNSELAIKEISRNIKETHILRLIRIPSLDIKPCRACYRCIMGKECPDKDDMSLLISHIVASEAVILASPVYFLGLPGPLKSIIDKGFLFYEHIEKTKGKPCILIGLYGMRERIGVTTQTLQLFASLLGMDVRANITIRAMFPGDIIRNKRAMALLKKIGENLFSQEPPIASRVCPFCGCDIVRIKGSTLICTLCHGHFIFGEKGKIEKIRKGKIPKAIEHRFWLKEKKVEFLKKKRELIKDLSPYKEIGEWIEQSHL